MFLEELDPKKNFGEYLAYGTTDKPSFGNYGNIFENMNHPKGQRPVGGPGAKPPAKFLTLLPIFEHGLQFRFNEITYFLEH